MILVVSGKKITDPLLIDVYTTVYEGIIDRRKIHFHLRNHHGKKYSQHRIGKALERLSIMGVLRFGWSITDVPEAYSERGIS